MTTDNRTTEATLPSGRCSNPECPLNRAHSGPCAPQEWTGGDAVVLAAKYLAQAASDWSDTETDEHSHSLECTNWEAYQRDAHDMRAALVAAQGAAPQAESEDNVTCRCGHGTGSHDFSDPQEPCREIVCDCRGWFGVSPVLPSSGVDEDKLAEVIEAEIDKLRHETRLYPDIYKAEVAHAVAEWLKEQGGESSGE